MDQRKLKQLQEKYGDPHGGEFHDPKFAAVADHVFDARGTRSAPYAGVSTLLDAPYAPWPAPDDAPPALEAALVGVPMDLGVTNRPGARFGPRALRTMERIGPYNQVLGCTPVQELAVADVGDVPFRSRFSLDACLDDIEQFFARIAATGAIPVSAGGDHSVTLPILRAIARDAPVGLVHVDAHCDTGGLFDQTKFHHGGPFRHAVLEGLLDPERTVQIGIRGSSEYLWEFSLESGMTVIHADDVSRLGIDEVVRQARAVVGEGPVYISFDVDGLDPVFAAGTGTPEVGGLTTREALALLRGLAGVDVVGGDVVEVAPQYDATTNTAQAGAQLLFEILSLVRLSPGLAARREAPGAG